MPTLVQAMDQILDRSRLVAGGLVLGMEFELGHRIKLVIFGQFREFTVAKGKQNAVSLQFFAPITLTELEPG